MGSDSRCCYGIGFLKSFNPRSHMGSDSLTYLDCLYQLVSIHAPTWGATIVTEGGYYSYSVSIHAPTWGATVVVFHECGIIIVSIHAPTWGATSHSTAVASKLWRFNPRSHMGSDDPQEGGNNGESVSIHAPTWGATTLIVASLRSNVSFNPRSHMGSDTESPCSCRYCPCFNPRSHMGSDWLVRNSRLQADWFQSTLPHGERPLRRGG